MRRGRSSRNARGSTYFIVLATVLLVTTMSLAAVLAARVAAEAGRLDHDHAIARACAHGALRLAEMVMAQEPDWRFTRPHGDWFTDRAFGGGVMSLSVTDPDDADLSDDPGQRVLIRVEGRRGIARVRLEVEMEAVAEPLQALGSSIHAHDNLTIRGDGALLASGASITVNDKFQNAGLVLGNVVCDNASPAGTIYGTLTDRIDDMPRPDSGVADLYARRATEIPYKGDIEDRVLGPGVNPWGAANADGLYFIDAGSQDVLIAQTRVSGTLVIRTSGKVTLDEAVLFEALASNQPALIVDGDLRVTVDSGAVLSESARGVNFNPDGAPYEDVTDSDTNDTYPCRFVGLVHATGDIEIVYGATFEGVVLSEDDIELSGTVRVAHESRLEMSPPPGYWQYAGMRVVYDTWRRLVD